MDKFRLWATINTLRKVSKEYPDKTIENVIAQLEARREEMKLEIVSQDNKKKYIMKEMWLARDRYNGLFLYIGTTPMRRGSNDY